MNVYVASAGLIVLLVGLGGVTGLIPLSTVGSVTINSVTATCTPLNVCSASASVTNVAETDLPLSIWFVVKNSIGQTVFVESATSSIAVGTTSTITKSLGTLGSGSYTLNVFSMNSLGYPVSYGANSGFTTGTFMLTIFLNGVPKPTISPLGTVTSPSFQCACIAFLYVPSTSVNITEPLGTFTINGLQYVFDGWTITKNGVDRYVNKSSIQFTMDTNIDIEANAKLTAANFGATINPLILPTASAGSINPSGIQAIFPSATYGPISVTFTATPSTGYNGGTFKLYGGPTGDTLVATGNKTITITYSQLQPYLSNTPFSKFYLNVYFNQLLQVDISAVIGATITPSPGKYYYKLDSTLQVSYVLQSGYCSNGWQVNGVPAGTANPLTVTVKGYTSIGLLAYAAVNGQCNETPPPPGDGLPGGISLVGIALVIGGGITTAIGLRMKRSDES